MKLHELATTLAAISEMEGDKEAKILIDGGLRSIASVGTFANDETGKDETVLTVAVES